jgi:hypothetical protein
MTELLAWAALAFLAGFILGEWCADMRWILTARVDTPYRVRGRFYYVREEGKS